MPGQFKWEGGKEMSKEEVDAKMREYHKNNDYINRLNLEQSQWSETKRERVARENLEYVANNPYDTADAFNNLQGAF